MQIPAPLLAYWQRFRKIPSTTRLVVFSLCTMLGAVVALGGGILATDFLGHRVGATSDSNSSWPKIFQKTYGKSVFIGERHRINLLILGIDYNHDEKGIIYTKGARSDTMMVASIGDEAQYLNILSIPRDTYTLISESIGFDKINSAFSYGGVKQTRETVSHFLGIPVNYYLIVKVHGAKKIIDALGGLPVEVEKTMDYDDNWGHLHIHLKKGPQILNGEQAVGYARFRHDEEGDLGRIRRQQQVIRALVRRLKDPGTITKFPQLAAAVKETLETDLTVEQMIDLALLYKDFDQSKLRSGQIKGDDDTVDGAMVLVPYEPDNLKIVRRLLKDDVDLGLKDMRIRLVNASGDPYLGNQMADEMNLEGFNVVKVEEASGKTLKQTEVVEHTRSPRVQARLRQLLPQAKYREACEEAADYDVTIKLGSDQGTLVQRPAEPQPASASNWEPEAPAYPVYQPEVQRWQPAARPEPVPQPAAEPEAPTSPEPAPASPEPAPAPGGAEAPAPPPPPEEPAPPPPPPAVEVIPVEPPPPPAAPEPPPPPAAPMPAATPIQSLRGDAGFS